MERIDENNITFFSYKDDFILSEKSAADPLHALTPYSNLDQAFLTGLHQIPNLIRLSYFSF